MNTITLDQVKAAVMTFHTTTLPPMSNAWDTLRKAAVDAVRLYEDENDVTLDMAELIGE